VQGVGSGAGTGQWAKSSPGLDVVKDETDDKELDAEEAEVKKMYKELGHDVEFADLQIQTSNIKVNAACNFICFVGHAKIRL